MKYCVYHIKCLLNGIVYIGRSQEIEKRWRSHKNMLRKSEHNNFYLQLDWNKFGEECFEFKILNTYDNKEATEIKEQEYIDDETIIKYNISDAKMGGDTFTNNPRKEEIRKLKSFNSSGEKNPMYGKPKSELTLKRIKEVNSKPISIEGSQYPSLSEASKVLGIGNTTISYRLNSDSDRFKEWKYI